MYDGLPGLLRSACPRCLAGATYDGLPGLLRSARSRGLAGATYDGLPGVPLSTCPRGLAGVAAAHAAAAIDPTTSAVCSAAIAAAAPDAVAAAVAACGPQLAASPHWRHRSSPRVFLSARGSKVFLPWRRQAGAVRGCCLPAPACEAPQHSTPLPLPPLLSLPPPPTFLSCGLSGSSGPSQCLCSHPQQRRNWAPLPPQASCCSGFPSRELSREPGPGSGPRS